MSHNTMSRELGRRGGRKVASMATVGMCGGTISCYEHVRVSRKVIASLAANIPFATRGASVTFPRDGNKTPDDALKPGSDPKAYSWSPLAVARPPNTLLPPHTHDTPHLTPNNTITRSLPPDIAGISNYRAAAAAPEWGALACPSAPTSTSARWTLVTM
jgi:hypothetical protein